VNFTLKLYRPEIKDVSTWQESWNGQFYSAPNSNSFLTRFDSQYYAYPWFNGKLDGDLETTYSFANIDANKGTFIISGNPFYKTITSSTSDTDYDFNWSYYNKVDVSTFIVRNDDSPINDLNDVFYGQPNVQDVIQALKNRIKSTYVNTISWNQIDITITSSSISLKGTSSSICYTTAEKTISYTLKT
jgi:hypothetical protein